MMKEKIFLVMTMKFKALLFSLALLPILVFGQERIDTAVAPVATELKVRMPEWRPKVFEQFPNGAPKLVLFYLENDRGEEEAVKRIHFFEGGRPMEETDLTVVDEKAPGFEAWKSTVVPHGVSVRFRESGEVERLAYFDRGLLHGPMKVFYPKGQLNHVTTFNQGNPEGKSYSYHENGQALAEGTYRNGKLEGDYVRFFASGKREGLIPYADGEIHGKLIEWYENGNEKIENYFMHGKLHSEGSQSAVILYDENHTIVELQDFFQGNPHGDHIKYHPNERQSYHACYVNGQIDGMEQWFSSDGKVVGESEHVQGKKVGKHWKKHENGTMAYLATYDKKGRLKEPIREFDENGQRVAEYSLNQNGQYEGSLQSWYSDGKLRADCVYVDGEFDGDQKQYFASGQLKLHGHYKNKVKEGVFQEWHQDGKLSFEGNFKEGNKDGEFIDWHANGQMGMRKNFKNALFDGDQREWYEDGTTKLEARYEMGKKDGTFTSWNEKGQLLFEGAFDQDHPIGSHAAYYDSGQKMESFHFLDGKKEGKHEGYYLTSQLKLTETFKGDLLDGESRGYYEDGSEAFIRNFKGGHPVGKQREFFSPAERSEVAVANLYFYNDKGELHGEQKTFYPSGAIKTQIVYEDGLLNGLKGLWDEEGNLLEESKYIKGKIEGRHFEKDQEGREIVYNYKNNRREGPHFVYYPLDVTEGEKVKAIEAFYKDNKLHGEAVEYDPSGAKISATTYKSGAKDGDAELFHRNGKTAIRLTFKNDLREGPSYQYFPTGQVYKEVEFQKDQKVGNEKTYFTDGRLNSVYGYLEGQLEGQAQHWNESGVLIFEAEYKEGKQHGKFMKYYDNGKPRLEQYFVEGKLSGVKKNFDAEGNMTETLYENGVKASH